MQPLALTWQLAFSVLSTRPPVTVLVIGSFQMELRHVSLHDLLTQHLSWLGGVMVPRRPHLLLELCLGPPEPGGRGTVVRTRSYAGFGSHVDAAPERV